MPRPNSFEKKVIINTVGFLLLADDNFIYFLIYSSRRSRKCM